MKKRSLLFFMTLLSLLFFQCQSDEITITPVPPPFPAGETITIEQNITSDVTWTSGNTYILNDMIVVTDFATLTIEPCVVVKAANGATGLIISQGSKIDAQGTPICPVIFTSVDDLLEPGEIVSPNLTGEDARLWSGIFLLGEAPVSSATSTNIIPISSRLDLSSFGGNKPNDDSGTLRYVSIRHTGYETAPFEVPSGLNLGGVGSGTQVSHLEVFACADDGILLLGGTVDLSNLITSFQDDGYDCDMGYAGTMDNLICIGGDSRNSSCLELDGGEGADNPVFTIKNASFKGAQNGTNYIKFQNNVNCIVENVYFFEFDAEAEVILREDEEADSWLAGLIDVVNLEFNTSHLVMGNTTIETIFVDNGDNGNDAFTIRKPDATIVTTPTTGADKTVFDGWTIASVTGALDDF